MAYIEPQSVLSPRNTIRSVDVLYNSGAGGWSAARLTYWDGEEKIGLRWNGDEGAGVGHPQSRAYPTWFVVPEELEGLVRDRAEELSNLREGGLLQGYRDMASDREREHEAQEWCEGLISDAANQER